MAKDQNKNNATSGKEESANVAVAEQAAPAATAATNSAEPIEGGMRITLKRGVSFDLLGDSIEDMMAYVGGTLLPERKVTMPEMLTEIPRLLKGFADKDSLVKSEAMQSAIKTADAELAALYAAFSKGVLDVVTAFNTTTGAAIAASRLYPANAPTIPTTKSRTGSANGSGVRATSADMAATLNWMDDNAEPQELKFEGKGAVVLLDFVRAMDYDSVTKLVGTPAFAFLSATPKMVNGKVDSTWKPVLRNADNSPTESTIWVHTGTNSATKKSQLEKLAATFGGKVTVS